MAKKRRKLGEILYKSGLIDKQSLIDALKTARESHKRIGETLIELGLVSEDNICKAIAHQFGMPYVNLDKHPVTKSMMALIPEEIIQKYNVLPISKKNGRLKLIISDPLNLDMLDTLRFRLNSELDCCIASKTKIRAFIDRNLDEVRSSIDATAAELQEQGHSIEEEIRRAEEAEEGDDGPVIRLVNMFIDEAVNLGTSDIHIEPMADRIRIRYRIDGVCSERESVPKNMQAAVMARLKIMSGMDIAERRIPQDGRIKKEISSSMIDFRVSALPGYHGESVVLRILRPDSVRVGIQSLGFAEEDYEKFQRIIKRPNGIFLVTGPTGSGKTTSLYAALQELNRPDKKIITAEDPVEYNFAGMNQCQVRSEIGLTFSAILRSMLRQAPNIILVGEIRDQEVADIAIQAALTGHLVFSTLHTNDAPSAITRLIDMGVKPFLVASAIQAIMAQRLVRLICPDCKTVQEKPDHKMLKLLGFKESELSEHPVYHGAGCKRCHHTGYHGRKGIFELMLMSSEIRELAFKRSPTNLIRKAAIAAGMRTLLDDGKYKIIQGITTLEEIAKTAQVEGLLDEEDI